ncbi:MAG: hypothetical protein ACREO5_00125, partial [Candidatus Binatia bacterium]
STPNANSSITVIPNGTGSVGDIQVGNNSNPAAASGIGVFRIGAAAVQVLSTAVNGGTTLPIRLIMSGVTAFQVDINSNIFYTRAIADQGYSLQVPITGFSITIPDNSSSLILNPAGVLATGTIVMPANPIDGQRVELSTTQTVTALTLNANAGQTISGNVTTLTAAAPASYRYVLSLTKWIHVD